MENNIKNFYDDDELKKYLFNLWETNEFITINGIKFDTVKYILAYDIASEQFEIYSENDSYYDYLICSFLSLSIKTINNQIITVE